MASGRSTAQQAGTGMLWARGISSALLTITTLKRGNGLASTWTLSADRHRQPHPRKGRLRGIPPASIRWIAKLSAGFVPALCPSRKRLADERGAGPVSTARRFHGTTICAVMVGGNWHACQIPGQSLTMTVPTSSNSLQPGALCTTEARHGFIPAGRRGGIEARPRRSKSLRFGGPARAERASVVRNRDPRDFTVARDSRPASKSRVGNPAHWP